ncbi:MAG: response regulator [Chitinophagaceae bacterium]
MKKPEYTIVLADDDLDDQAIIQDIFHTHSNAITIFNVADGEETLHLLHDLQNKNICPCLIILDINMPKLGGKETLLQLRADEKFRHVPIVLFSTSTYEEDKQFAEDHGAMYVTKPFTYENMEAAVKSFINICTHEGDKRSQA